MAAPEVANTPPAPRKAIEAGVFDVEDRHPRSELVPKKRF